MKSWVEVSGERLRQNFRAVHSVVGKQVEIVAVIKADAYGHGAPLCAPVLRDAGARWLGVTDVEEGAAVRAALGEDTTRILVMCGIERHDAARIIEHSLTPVLWTVEQVEALAAAADSAGKCVRVHVEVETGMSRQGAGVGEELHGLLASLRGVPQVRCEGVMTHLCCAEIVGAPATEAATERFLKALDQCLNAQIRPEFIHIANTSAVDEGSLLTWLQRLADGGFPSTAMVRTGLAMFGYSLPLRGPDGQATLQGKLQPVMTWKAPVIALREIAPGTTVGYGATFVAEKPMRLALLPVGYADGFRREASSGIGNGWVMVNGQRAPVVGRVSMNLTTVDVTGIASLETGSEVELLGKGVTAEDHACWADTIPYDILCGVRGRRTLT